MPRISRGRKRRRTALRFVCRAALLLPGAWGAAALWLDGPDDRAMAALLAAGFAGFAIVAAATVRPFGRALLLFAAGFGTLLFWWLSIPASNDRDWQADVARLPTAMIEGSQLTVRNVRAFEYGDTDQDYTEHWETRSYELDTLVGVDLYLVYWGPRRIAHTMVSWEFADGRHLAVSIETRREKGETYSAVRGFFRQFEIYYVVADERDLVGVRAKQRGEQVFLYRLTTEPRFARAVLLDYMAEVNRLAQSPRWYNALVHNCTTTIRHHARDVGGGNPWDWRILANGYIDEMGYERGTIDASLPFDELRRRSDITGPARDAVNEPGFSALIRAGLPGR